MRFLATFAALLFATTTAITQTSFSVASNSITIHGDASDNINFYDQIDIDNETGAFLKLTWDRTSMNLPNGWESSVCDKSTCYPNATSTEDLIFGAWGANYLNVHFYPNGNSGTGDVTIHVYKTNDPTDETTLTFTGTTDPVGVEELKNGAFSLFPNPANSNVHVRMAAVAVSNQSYEVLDLSGRVLKQGEVNAGSFTLSVEDLQSGIYFVKVIREGGDSVTRKFSKL